jgi:hypothetical protein
MTGDGRKWGRATLTIWNHKVTSLERAYFVPNSDVFNAKMGNIQINRRNCRTISSSGPQKAAAAEEYVLGGYAAENRGADFVQRRDSAIKRSA